MGETRKREGGTSEKSALEDRRRRERRGEERGFEETRRRIEEEERNEGMMVDEEDGRRGWKELRIRLFPLILPVLLSWNPFGDEGGAALLSVIPILSCLLS